MSQVEGSDYPPINFTNCPRPPRWNGAWPPHLTKARFYPSSFNHGQINLCRALGLHGHAAYYLALEKSRAAKIAKQNASLEQRCAELKAYAKKTQVEHDYNAARKAVLAKALHEFTTANPSAKEYHEVIFYFIL